MQKVVLAESRAQPCGQGVGFVCNMPARPVGLRARAGRR